MFTREQIIVRSKFVYKFSLTLMKLKVSSFQDLYEVDLFLVTTCWIYEKYELKNFEVCSKHWHFNAIEFQIMEHVTSWFNGNEFRIKQSKPNPNPNP